jgi:PPOX class probable F420-dependent enzyme
MGQTTHPPLVSAISVDFSSGGFPVLTVRGNPDQKGVPPMARTELPAGYADLLERPLFAHLATVRPDGSPQSSVMWFTWDGSRLRLTHTKTRQKFANLTAEPRVALSIVDPDDPYRTLEVRGEVESIEDDDETGSFYLSLQSRYGRGDAPVRDAAVRVIMTIRPDSFVAVMEGKVVS